MLGDGAFVTRVLQEAEEHLEHSYHLKSQGYDLEKTAARVSELLAIEKSDIFLPGKERKRVAARSLFCYWATRELGMSQVSLSRLLRLSPAAVTVCVNRGEKLARENGYALVTE